MARMPRVVALDVPHHVTPVSYTHLRANETRLENVCRLLLKKKNNNQQKQHTAKQRQQQKKKKNRHSSRSLGSWPVCHVWLLWMSRIMLHQSLIPISEPTRLGLRTYADYCLKKKTTTNKNNTQQNNDNNKKKKKTGTVVVVWVHGPYATCGCSGCPASCY